MHNGLDGGLGNAEPPHTHTGKEIKKKEGVFHIFDERQNRILALRILFLRMRSAAKTLSPTFDSSILASSFDSFALATS